MKYLLHILTCLGFIILFGCHNTHTEEVKNTVYTYDRYSQVPKYIKTYIDSISKEKFLIAEPGEPWDGGCVRGDNPFRQFISAELTPNFFTMEFQVGGFVSSTQKMTLSLTSGQITGHFDRGY